MKTNSVADVVGKGTRIEAARAMAFLESVLKSAPAKAHLAAVMGRGRVPDADEFLANDAATLVRCTKLLNVIENYVSDLREHLERIKAGGIQEDLLGLGEDEAGSRGKKVG